MELVINCDFQPSMFGSESDVAEPGRKYIEGGPELTSLRSVERELDGLLVRDGYWRRQVYG